MNITEKIKELALLHQKEIVELREYLHENPELDLDLFNTSRIIKEKLDSLGIEYTEMAQTGICALIRGEKGNVDDEDRKTVLLRGDMDALPIQEEADVPFKSKVEGKMHACGHDGHTAGLYGALLIINDLRGELEGNVKFAFQPGEERSGGAEKMIQEGILKNPEVNMAFGLHLWGPLKEDRITMMTGPMMASPDEFSITITGKGGHASAPELSIDPVVIAAQVVLGLQSIRSRMVSTFSPLVVTCSVIKAGEAFNVIPNDVVIKGTVRTLDKDLRDKVPLMMEQIIRGITSAYGANFSLNYNKYYPTLINDDEAVGILRESAIKILGEENYEELENPVMGGEDFSYFGYNVPSAFGFLGIAQKGKEIPYHHHPRFHFRSEMAAQSAKILSQVAFDAIEGLNKKKAEKSKKNIDK